MMRRTFARSIHVRPSMRLSSLLCFAARSWNGARADRIYMRDTRKTEAAQHDAFEMNFGRCRW